MRSPRRQNPNIRSEKLQPYKRFKNGLNSPERGKPFYDGFPLSIFNQQMSPVHFPLIARYVTAEQEK